MRVLPSSNLIFGLLIADSIKAAVLLLTAGCICGLAKRSSAAFRHQVWALAIVGVLVLPVLHFVLPTWHAPAVGATSKIWHSAISKSLLNVDAGDSVMAVNGAWRESSTRSWRASVLALWLVGAGFLLLRFAYGTACLTSVARHAKPLSHEGLLRSAAQQAQLLGLHQPVQVLIAKEPQTMPCTWGWMKPRILLPAAALTWSADRFNMVITHELAHLRRLDWPMRLVAEAARAIFWFHPLIWLAASQLRQESERACDDAVLNSGQPATRYAAELLELVRSANRYPAAALTVARKSTFERRFTSMLNPNVNRSRLSRMTALSTTAAACLCLISLASLRAPAEDLAGQFSGSVLDPRGAAVANATIEITNVTTHETRMTATNATGSFQFEGLSSGDYQMRVERDRFSEFTSPETLNSSNAPAAVTLSAGEGLSLPIRDNSPEVTTSEATLPGATPRRIRIGGNMASANLIRKVAPTYPPEAKAAGIQDAVVLEAVIDKSGAPISLRVANFEVDPSLARSAIETVSQWRYKPTLLNGDPIEVATTITVNYTLSE